MQIINQEGCRYLRCFVVPNASQAKAAYHLCKLHPVVGPKESETKVPLLRLFTIAASCFCLSATASELAATSDCEGISEASGRLPMAGCSSAIADMPALGLSAAPDFFARFADGTFSTARQTKSDLNKLAVALLL